jgi:hypothetical protein
MGDSGLRTIEGICPITTIRHAIPFREYNDVIVFIGFLSKIIATYIRTDALTYCNCIPWGKLLLL